MAPFASKFPRQDGWIPIVLLRPAKTAQSVPQVTNGAKSVCVFWAFAVAHGFSDHAGNLDMDRVLFQND